jgi:hypothetical protein
LYHTLARTLAADPADRYESGAQLAAALDGCRELRRTQRELPRLHAIGRLASRRPFLWLAIFALVPQIISTLVNISYNSLQIGYRPVEAPLLATIVKDYNLRVGRREFLDSHRTDHSRLNLSQDEYFWTLIWKYNRVVYPIALVVAFLVLKPIYLAWKRLHGNGLIDPAEVARARRAALQIPLWLLALAGLGWIPGGILFPTLINTYYGPLDPKVFIHFVMSFTLSGLIAIAYSMCG